MDEKAFNLIFNSRSVSSVHHRVAIEAVRFLDGNWPDLFLKHYGKLLEGSKAPDQKFKDFKNHVCHMPDGWGGAATATKEWFEKTVGELRNQNWAEAVYNAGVMCHYFADVNHPFHTGQTEEEERIHSFTEWGAAEIYPELRKRMSLESLEKPPKKENIKDLVFNAAKNAHKFYEELLTKYDATEGEKGGWGKGYTEPLKDEIASVIANAIQGTAYLFRRAIDEAGNPDPGEISLTMTKVTTKLTTLVERIRRFKENIGRKTQTRRMRKEYQKTSRVVKSLPPNGQYYMKALNDGEIKPVKLTHIKPAETKKAKKLAPKTEKEVKKKPAVAPKKPKWEPAITKNSSIEEAAEVGSTTATRLKKIGINKVGDLVTKNPQEIIGSLKKNLNYTKLDPEEIKRMQVETKMMLEVPRLRVHDTVILYQAGVRSKATLEKEEQNALWKKVQEAVKDPHVQKFLKMKNLQPTIKEIAEWIESAKE